MPSQKSQFQLFNRGYEETTVLVPGWGTDYRVFFGLDLHTNYLLPVSLSLDSFEDDLLEALEELCFSQVSLMGWSLGGFLSARFAGLYPDRVSALTLVSIRHRYDHAALADVAERVKKNKKAFMYKFYLSCFSRADTQGLEWFRQSLLDYYVETVSEETLLSGIAYLAQASLDGLPGDFGTHVIHGADDVIAPVVEAKAVASRNGARFTSLVGLGHIPFLNEAFHAALCGHDHG